MHPERCFMEYAMLPDHPNPATTSELASAKFGFCEEKLSRVQAFHFKGGQGAKTATGGHLPAAKVTGRIAQVRGLPEGKPAVSPPRFKEFETAADFKAFGDHVRQITGGVPVGFKMSAQHIERVIDFALEAGADDHGAKPFSMEERAARVEALGRRVAMPDSSDLLTVGDMHMDVHHRRVNRAGKPVALSPREFELLHVLMRVRFDEIVLRLNTLGYYLEAKYKLTPMLSGAVRWNQQTFSRIARDGGQRIRWGREAWRLDLAVIRRFSPHVQLKLQFQPAPKSIKQSTNFAHT